MDSNQPELDSVGPPPEQEQLQEIMNLTQSLTQGAKEITPVWKDKGWSVENGNDIDAASVSLLTDEGKRKYPDYPRAMIRIFRNKPEGRTEQKYNITEVYGKLRIDRHDNIETPEEKEEMKRWKANLERGLTQEQADEALSRIVAKLDQRSANKEFEKKIGHSFVDKEETQAIIDRLAKSLKDDTTNS